MDWCNGKKEQSSQDDRSTKSVTKDTPIDILNFKADVGMSLRKKNSRVLQEVHERD